MKKYNVKFEGQSNNAGESMPLGGRDIGCNVWGEQGKLYLYMAQSGSFDEVGNMVKAGRLRIELTPNPFNSDYTQELILEKGSIVIKGGKEEKSVSLELWVDIYKSILHIQMESSYVYKVDVYYENWRIEENGYHYPDEWEVRGDSILFWHQNKKEDQFDAKILQEGLDSIKGEFPNVQKNLVFGGCIRADGLQYVGKGKSSYAGLGCEYHQLGGEVSTVDIDIFFNLSHGGNTEQWKKEVEAVVGSVQDDLLEERKKTLVWWDDFWNRSYVHIRPDSVDESDINFQISRNYQLFRYMLACNTYGEYPTKFNGGLFTVDPVFWGSRYGARTPDERDWGGIVFTAQNQRHVYWPMLKNGDFEMMKPQFEFYIRLLNGAKARSKYFLGVENAACIPEQTDANGLSAYYGLYGLDYPLHVRYHYVTSVEFSYMMLKYMEATGEGVKPKYLEFIDTILNFYNQKYNKLDERGKRVIFPSTAQETYHKADLLNIWGEEGRYAANYNEDEVAVTNPADVIFALRAVLEELLEKGYGEEEQRRKWKKLDSQLPPVPTEYKKGHKVIAPCEEPKKYKIANCEFPQLYAAFPYHEIGIGESNSKDLKLAIDTYFYGWDDEAQLKNLSWMYVGILAARLGLTEEAYRYQTDKLKDSGRRFPAFWGPGHDYTPDHNWGGCGMTGLQEMLLQNFDGKIYLLPAWPKGLDVNYKLWIENRVYIVVEYKNNKLSYMISDPTRKPDIVLPEYIEKSYRMDHIVQ